MAEWSNAAVLKTAEPETVPGVRIPLLPPLFLNLILFCIKLAFILRFLLEVSCGSSEFDRGEW